MSTLKRKRLYAVFGIMLAVSLASNAAIAQPCAAEDAEHSRRVDALMARWNHSDTPGAAVLVVQAGETRHSKGYGMRDIAAHLPITPDTPFLLASITKPFTALAVLQLVQRGRVRLDDTLDRFFPDFAAYARTITVRDLLHHTSGVPDYETLFARSGRISANWPRSAQSPPDRFEPTVQDALALLAEQPTPLFAAGARMQYSNSGYVLLALIVEKVSGISYARYMREQVFHPAGMARTQVYDETRPVIPSRAVSYERKDDAYHDIDYTPINLIYGEDNIYSTISDLVRWDAALDSHSLLRADLWRQACTPGKLRSGAQTGYGFGWVTGRYLGREYIAHTGGWVGVRTLFVRYPQQHFTVVILSNLASFDCSRIANEITKIYLGSPPDKAALSLDAATLQSYAGRYDMGNGKTAEIDFAAGHLYMTRPGHDRDALVPQSPRSFRIEGNEEVRLAFRSDTGGRIVRFDLQGQSTGFLPKRLSAQRLP